MSDIEDAWDLLQGIETPEAEALRALFGKAAFRVADDAGVKFPFTNHEATNAVELVQLKIAKAYLYAHGTKRR